MLPVLYLVLGVGLLFVGGEALIRGALALARRVGVSPLLSGLVIVGFGTSAPELVVSVDAALNHRPDIAVGDVVGSNIANVLLILGLCALVRPLRVQPLALRRDALGVVVTSGLFVLLVGGGALGRADAALLLAGLAAYLVWAYWTERDPAAPAAEVHRAEAEELVALPRSVPFSVLSIALGLALLIGGSRVLLLGAVELAQRLGVPEAVIGLTLVAVGTSVPELAVSLLASLRGHADVAVGNILGSNLFNLLGILGVSALLAPLPIHARILAFDQWVLLGVSLLLLLFLYTGRRLSRLEGAVFLVAYAAYLVLGPR